MSDNKKKRNKNNRKKERFLITGIAVGGAAMLCIIVIIVLLAKGLAGEEKQLQDETAAAVQTAPSATDGAGTSSAYPSSAVESGITLSIASADAVTVQQETESKADATETETQTAEPPETETDAAEKPSKAPKEFVECVDYSDVAHNLPVIKINTENSAPIVSKTDYIRATFSMDANGAEGFFDIPETSIRIRGRGHITWRRFPKKSMKMNFDEKICLLGDEKDKDWLLIGNYHDRSLSRNYLSNLLAKQFEHIEYAMDSYPVDVYMNGEYFGVYDLSEQVEVAGGRVDFARDETAVDSGFMVEIGSDKFDIMFKTASLKNMEIKYPKTPTPEQRQYVIDYISKVDDLVISDCSLDELAEYVDIDSLVDWILLMEFTYNWDAAFTRNVFMFKEPGGKLKFGPAWDFDLSMGGLGYDDPSYQSWALSTNGLCGVTWETHFLNNEEFFERLKNRWIEKREGLMDYVWKTLSELLPVLEPSYNDNYERWMKDVEGKNIQWEWPAEYTQTTLSGMYGYLQSFFQTRYAFLNKALIDGYKPPVREQEIQPKYQ